MDLLVVEKVARYKVYLVNLTSKLDTEMATRIIVSVLDNFIITDL